MSVVLVGFGNVGQSFASLLLQKQTFLRERFDVELLIVGAADSGIEKNFHSAYSANGLNSVTLLDLKKNHSTVAAYPGAGCTDSAIELIENSNSDLLLETTPTNLENGEPGLSHVRAALKAGMHVVTSNKGPLVFGWKELRELARSQGKEFRFGASVAGALPIIPMGHYSLMGSEVSSIQGILNGTTNYILSQMERKGITMKDALSEAQRMGIAEANPKLDLEGYDTAFKLLIAANAIMDADAKLSDIEIRGIEKISAEQVGSARERGNAYKLIGRADRINGRLEMRVGVEEVDGNHPFRWVNGTWKSVLFKTDLLGEVLVTGGASSPKLTAGAMLRDVLNIMNEIS